MLLALSLSLIALTLPDLAEAKRLGGGRSFGSKPAYSQKYQKSSPQQPNQPGAPQAAPTGGRGAFGGLLGGLLAGGLLGSLLFGGAFSGIGLLDILLIGGGLFLLFRFLHSHQTALETPSSFSNSPTPPTILGVDMLNRGLNADASPPSAGMIISGMAITFIGNVFIVVNRLGALQCDQRIRRSR